MLSFRPEISELKPYVPGILEPGKIKLASNENPLGPSPRAIEAIKVHVASAQLYPDDNAPQLRRALARHWQFDENWFIPGNGSDEILQLAAATFMRTGEEALVANHTFSVYSAVTLLYGGVITRVPLVNGCFDLDQFAAAISAKTRIIFLCSPNNPTGTIIHQKDLERFLAAVPSRILVVLDEAYAEFVVDPEYQNARTLVHRFPNLLVTRTFSKLYGLAGLRIGYGLGQADLINKLQRTRPPFNVNNFAMAAAVAALDDQDFIKHSLLVCHSGRSHIQTALAELGLDFYPSQSNFICMETKRDAQAMYDAISAQGITIRPLTSFGLPTSIRVSIGTAQQNQLFIAALKNALHTVAPLS